MVRAELEKLNVPYAIFNQREFDKVIMSFEISRGRVTGQLQIGGDRFNLKDIIGVYTRLMDHRLLPKIRHEPQNSYRRRYCHALHDTLMRWYEVSSARVINRTGPMGSNYSKPYQLQLIKDQGFAVPETLVTNDPALVRDFLNKHGNIVYKSISSVRSIVRVLKDDDLKRMNCIRWCPVQFQRFVEGTNIRVHTLNKMTFATAITTNVTDYRYASRFEGGYIKMKTVSLPHELAERCVRLSQALKLDFAGIDLKISSDNKVYCLEVNPSPAFSFYEANTGQPIARALARYLSGAF
jgi:hypothetical protein